MTVIEWKNPPEPERSNGGAGKAGIDWHAVAVQLRRRPGRWGRFKAADEAKQAADLASLIRRGKLAPFRPGGWFDATSRKIKGKSWVYARYVGEAGSEATQQNDLPPVGPGSSSPEPGPATWPVSGEPHDPGSYCEVCRGYRDDPHDCATEPTKGGTE